MTPQALRAELAERRVALIGADAARPVPGAREQPLAVDALPAERVEGDLDGAPARAAGRRVAAPSSRVLRA